MRAPRGRSLPQLPQRPLRPQWPHLDATKPGLDNEARPFQSLPTSYIQISCPSTPSNGQFLDDEEYSTVLGSKRLNNGGGGFAADVMADRRRRETENRTANRSDQQRNCVRYAHPQAAYNMDYRHRRRICTIQKTRLLCSFLGDRIASIPCRVRYFATRRFEERLICTRTS